jgi:hypothetical protein
MQNKLIGAAPVQSDAESKAAGVVGGASAAKDQDDELDGDFTLVTSNAWMPSLTLFEPCSKS